MRFYHKTLLNYFFMRQHISVIESEKIISLLFVAHYSQLISVLHEHDAQNSYNTQIIDLGQLFDIYRYIWRPYEILLNNNNFREYAYIIPLIQLFLIFLDFIWELFQTNYGKESNYEMEVCSKRSIVYQIILKITQIHNLVFSIWYIDLCMISIIWCQENFDILNLALSIITLILITIVSTLNIFCSESIEFPGSPIHNDIISNFQYSNIILIIAIIYLNNKNFLIKETVLHSLNLIVFASSLYIESFKIQKSVIQKYCLVILTYTLVHNFTYIFFQYFLDENYKIALNFTFFPLLANLVFSKSNQSQQLQISSETNILNLFQNLKILSFLSKTDDLKGNVIRILSIQLLQKGSNDIFQSQLQSFNEKVLQLNTNDQPFWYLKYLYVKFSMKQHTETLILINQFCQKQTYSEVKQKFIKNQFQLSIFQEFKLAKLIQKVHQTLHDNIMKTYLISNKQLDGIVNEGLQEDQIKQQLTDLLGKKFEIYQELSSNTKQEVNYFFEKSYQLINKALKFEKFIKDKLSLSKSHFLNQLLIILYVYFFNNILQAELLKYYQLGNEDLKINLFDQMEMLKLKICDDLVHFDIQYISSRLFSQLGYDKSCEKSSLKFQTFLADNFRNQHKDLVLEFLETGKCKYLSGIQQEVIVRGNQNIYYFAYLQINFENQILSELVFNSFIELYEDQPQAIILNIQNQIVGYTKAFEVNILNHNNQSESILFKDVKTIVPNFIKIVGKDFLKTSILNNSQQCILKIQKVYGLLIVFIQNEIEEFQQEKTQAESENKEIVQLYVNDESFVQAPNSFDQEVVGSPLSLFHKEEKQEMRLFMKNQETERKKQIGNESQIQSSIQAANNKKKKKIIDDDDHHIENDKASSKFSRAFLDNSIYFQKYSRLNQFVNSQSKASFTHISIILLFLGFAINIIFQMIINFHILPEYQKVNHDADLISIKANFMTPVHNCVTAQVCVVDYILLAFAYKQVDEKLALQKLLFGLDSVLQSYKHLKISFSTQINNVNLQEFFYDESIQMYQQHNLTLIPRNISLKNALIYYYQAQYFVTIINYYAVLSYIPSSEFVYYMSNIIKIDDYMDKLNTEVTDFIIYNITVFEDKQLRLFFKMLFLEIIVLTLALFYIIKHQVTLSNYFKQFTSLNSYALQIEQQNLKELIENLIETQTLKDYQFELAEFEKRIQQKSLIIQQRSLQINSQIYKPAWKKIFPTVFIIFLLYIIPQSVVQQSNKAFFSKFQQSARQLFQLSQLSSAVTAIYEIREINYMISAKLPFFEFFTDQKRLEQNVKVVGELKKIEEFLTIFPYTDYNSMLIDDDFNAMLSDMLNSNICKYLIHYNQTLAEEHCEQIYDGVMLLGLMNVISKIYSQISSEYQITNGFEFRLRGELAAFEESEIGLIASDVILVLQQKFYHGIISKTNEVIQMYQILIAIYICMSCFMIVVLLNFYFPYLTKQTLIVKSMIFLVPTLQFYLDQDFDQKFRKIVQQDK